MENNPRVAIFPDELLNQDQELSIVKLKHPRTETPMLCVVSEDSQLYEIVNFKENFTSWFIDNQVVEDGGYHMVTEVDPLFFILNYLNKEGKFCPLEDSLIDADYPDTHKIASCFTQDDLAHVTNFKKAGNLLVYSYDKEKTLEWLKKKVELAKKSLKDSKVDISDGSRAASYKPASDDDAYDEKNCCIQACQLISEYLCEGLSNELYEIYGLKKEDSGIENSMEEMPKEKKQKTGDVSPIDDYSKGFKAPNENKSKTKMTAAQSRLMKSDKTGMKSISSFFSKK